jgi:hypothetical protein
VYANDKVIGIIIMVLSLCFVGLGSMMMLGGGVLAASGAAASADPAIQKASSDAAAAGVTGAVLMVASVIMIATGFLGVAIGYGIMKSLRWGFIMGTVVYGLNLLGTFQSRNMISLVIGAALFAYCLMRLLGKIGPKPV